MLSGWRQEPMDTLDVGCSLPPKRAAPIDVEQFLKKPKVETQLVEPKYKYKPIPLLDFAPLGCTDADWLPEGVGWFMDLDMNGDDAYQRLLITDDSIWNRDVFERMLNYEEQRLYLKFYVRLSKEVKEGESWADATKRLAVGVDGDLSVLKKKMAIGDYLMNRAEEARAKENCELYFYILDEVMKNKDYDAVAAKIIEDNLYPGHHVEIRNCCHKSFVMKLKKCCQEGILINEAHKQMRDFFEAWRSKYGTMARYYMLKVLIADKLHILPEPPLSHARSNRPPPRRPASWSDPPGRRRRGSCFGKSAPLLHHPRTPPNGRGAAPILGGLRRRRTTPRTGGSVAPVLGRDPCEVPRGEGRGGVVGVVAGAVSVVQWGQLRPGRGGGRGPRSRATGASSGQGEKSERMREIGT